MRIVALSALVAIATCATATGSIVSVTIKGNVEYNQITAPPLGQFAPGQLATISFTVDSDTFVNNPQFPTRGYVINQPTFTLSSPSASIGLKSPFPAGKTPYFVIRNNDPAVDGFFISTDLSSDIGVPLNQQGIFGPFVNNFAVTYTGNTLSSLNILDALGTYEFNGLTNFNWAIQDGAFDPMYIDFTSITIAAVPGPSALAVFALLPIARRRRR